MSKVVASLPKGLMKNSVVGAGLALFSYIAFQFLSALLIHGEMVGEGMLYPMVCVSAAVSSFLGCGYSAVRGGNGSVLSASTVVLVFLALTVAVALLTAEVGAIGAGLTGVGVAMAVGGLLAAVIAGLSTNKKKSRRETAKTRRAKR